MPQTVRSDRWMMAIVFARWSADCARRAARKRGLPVTSRTGIIVFATRRGMRVVVACCARCSRRGVREGMSLAHARAICPQERMEFPCAQENALLRACAVWCRRYAPLTMIEKTPGPPAILVDLTGCQRIYDDEAQLVKRVTSELAARGFEARVATAPTGAAAVALAQNRSRSDLLGCPLASLRIDADAIEALKQVNVSTVGQLRALERSSVAVRYSAATLRRLDEAFGDSVEFLEPVRTSPLPVAEKIFEGPVTDLQGIRLTIRELVDSLCEQLRQRVRGGREFELVALCADAPTHAHRVMLGAPSTLARHISGMFEPHIDRIPMGMGIEALKISVLRMGRCCGQELAGQWIDTLIARLGDTAVLRGGFRECHDPLRAVRWIVVSRLGFSREHALRDACVAVANAWRPSMILERPEMVIVERPLADEIRWRGRTFAIARWSGPERIALPLWGDGSSGQSSMDYWRVETQQGRWLWLCRRVDGWSVAGIWA